jgi:RHS repeat-associated protein
MRRVLRYSLLLSMATLAAALWIGAFSVPGENASAAGTINFVGLDVVTTGNTASTINGHGNTFTGGDLVVLSTDIQTCIQVAVNDVFAIDVVLDGLPKGATAATGEKLAGVNYDIDYDGSIVKLGNDDDADGLYDEDTQVDGIDQDHFVFTDDGEEGDDDPMWIGATIGHDTDLGILLGANDFSKGNGFDTSYWSDFHSSYFKLSGWPVGPRSGLLERIQVTAVGAGVTTLNLRNFYGTLDPNSPPEVADPNPLPFTIANGSSGDAQIAVGVPCPLPAEAGNGGPAVNINAAWSLEPINLATGNYTYQQTDVTIAGKGLPIAFSRSYNSIGVSDGPLGYGWQHNLHARLVFDNADHNVANVTVIEEEGKQDGYTRQPDATYTPPPGVFAVLTRDGGDASFTLRRKDRSRLHFDSSGILQSVEDRNGNQTTLTYSAGLLTAATDPSSRTLTFAYGGNGHVTSVTDPLGRVTTYTYDANGDLRTVTDPGLQTTAYSYDGAHQMLNITDPLGHVVMTNAFTAGKVTQQTNADGKTWTFTYNAGNTVETDPLGRTTTHYYDPALRETSVVDALGGTTTYGYDGYGSRNAVTDPLGHATTMSYDARGNLLTLADALGNTSFFTYSAQDDLLSKTDANGHTATFTYDVKGNLLTTTDALAGLASFTHDVQGQLLTATDPRGNTSSFAYDANGYQASATDPLGGSMISTYDNGGRLFTQTDPLGQATTFAYDAVDRLLTATDPLGHAMTYAYDANGNKTSVTDANGHTTAFTYDPLDRLVTVTDPLGHATTYAYDANGNKTSVTDANGHTTAFTYDPLNRLVTTTDPLGHAMTYAYDANGNKTSATDANGHTTTFTYDLLDRLVTVTDPLGHATTYAYDANGNKTSVTDANGHTTTFTYDPLDRLVTVTDPLGHATTYAYDANGNKTSLTDANAKTTTYGYDSLNRLTTVTDANGGVVMHSYDAAGNRTGMTDANAHTTQYTYDSLNRLVTVTDPALNTTTYTYDDVGNRLTRTDGNGITTAYGYDSLDRLGQITYPDQPAVSYTYDAVGNRLTMTDLTGTTASAYDAAGRLVSVTNPGGAVVVYGYDAAGKRTSLTYPDGKVVTYAYDDASRLTTVTDWTARVTGYTYDNAARLTGTDLPNGVHAARSYNNADQLLAIAHSKGGSNLVTASYALDAVGNRQARIETVGAGAPLTDNYGYDNLYQLTSANYGEPAYPDQTYSYDPAGNRTQIVEGLTPTNYTYDAADRLLTAGGTAYAFDANGNQVREGNRTFTYDRENRLIQVADWTTSPDGVCADTNWDGTVDSGDLLAVANAFGTRAGSNAYQPVLDPRQDGAVNAGDLLVIAAKLNEQCQVVDASAYNGDGLRVYRSESGSTQRHSWDTASPLTVIMQDSAGTTYEYGLELILDETAGAPTYYSQDGLGSTVLTTNAAGASTGTYDYDVFGAPRTPPAAPAFGYTGEQRDASQFVYLRARTYDPAGGRFLTVDPAANYVPGSTYVYTRNAPSNYVDPLGLYRQRRHRLRPHPPPPAPPPAPAPHWSCLCPTGSSSISGFWGGGSSGWNGGFSAGGSSFAPPSDWYYGQESAAGEHSAAGGGTAAGQSSFGNWILDSLVNYAVDTAFAPWGGGGQCGGGGYAGAPRDCSGTGPPAGADALQRAFAQHDLDVHNANQPFWNITDPQILQAHGMFWVNWIGGAVSDMLR